MRTSSQVLKDAELITFIRFWCYVEGRPAVRTTSLFRTRVDGKFYFQQLDQLAEGGFFNHLRCVIHRDDPGIPLTDTFIERIIPTRDPAWWLFDYDLYTPEVVDRLAA